MTVLDVANQIGAILGYVGVPGGALLAAKLKQITAAIDRAEKAAERAEAAKVAAETAKSAAETAKTHAEVAATKLSPQAAQRIVIPPAGVDLQEVERVVHDHYETVKRSLKLEWRTWLDTTREKFAEELERMVSRVFENRVPEEVESAIKRALRRSKPDQIDPYLDQRIDNIDRRIELIEKQLAEAASERTESWRHFHELVGEMKTLLRRGSLPPR